MRGPEALEFLKDGEFLEFIYAPIEGQMGLPAFAIVAGSALVLGLWTWTEDFLAPAIVLALFGGTIIAAVPGPAAIIGVSMVLVALGIGFFAIWGSTQ